MHYKLLPHLWYTISSTADCDVECSNGISIHLPAHFQHFLFADMESIDVSGEATVTQNPPNFTPYSESRGEEWTADLRIGHAAADAVAAVCTLTLGDLGTSGTLADSNGQSVELNAPHAYATGSVDIADATAAGTITFGEHEAVAFEASAAAKAGGWLKYFRADNMQACSVGGKSVYPPQNVESQEAWETVLAEADCGVACTSIITDAETVQVFIQALQSGATGNDITLDADAGNEVSGPTLTGGTDARTPQDVVDILNDSEDCPAVAVLAHVDAQDAKAVFTPLESYEPGQDYQLSIMENDAEVNSWTWQANEGDGVQELVDALNDDTGQIWYNTRGVEASLEDGKVVLRKLNAHGAASNGYSVSLDDNPPFEESEETPIQGGRDESDTITFTAKEYGVNDTITISGSLFENAEGMSGGHGDYTIAELLEAIGDEFADITAAEGAADGTITLTATTAGKAANTITYTATGCFGSGATRQGSTTRGKDAVEQTEYKIYLNGAELDVEPAPVPEHGLPTDNVLKNRHVYIVEVPTAGLTLTYTLAENATAELWLDVPVLASPAQQVTFPAAYWLDGTDGAGSPAGAHDVPPAIDKVGRYHYTLREEGGLVYANMSYQGPIPTPAQS